ncbi:MAG: cation:proton antiporter [Flavobacteriales bacterium]|jgi:hypothetical protein|nr:cation:proton antiporter [Flavobacteriales bacterium]
MLAAIEISNAYGLVIGASLVIIVSYFFQLFAKKTNIPSPLLLIALGILLQQGLQTIGITRIPYEGLLLEILGTVGLIFIVLEAALDLELNKDKWPIIWKSFLVALVGLLLTSFSIAGFLHLMVIDDFMSALVYAIPLSIMSSAIIIPSVGGLVRVQKEFMVYESTFSDILGIMFFYLVLGNVNAESAGHVIGSVFSNIGITVVLAVIFGYGLVWVIQKLTGEVKLFMTIAILLLIYAIEKIYHLSPLILILAFGLMLNNYQLFWFKGLRKFVDHQKIRSLHNEFHLLTLETAFVIRTFFFVMFGLTISLASLLSWTVLFFSLVIVVFIYLVRLLLLWLFDRKNIFPLVYIAPRGLITILLFFQIYSSHPEYVSDSFERGILLQVVFISSIVMTISLIQNGWGIKEVERNRLSGDLEIDDEEQPDAATDDNSVGK